MMPPILSCLVAKRICEDPAEDHWPIRQLAAQKMAYICSRYGSTYQTLQPRVTRTLLRAFLDPLKALTTHYGAIMGLTTIGADVVKVLLVPNMESYMGLLRKELKSDEEVGDDVEAHLRRDEAQKCYGALVDAAVAYLMAESRAQATIGGGDAMDTDMVVVRLKTIDHGPKLAALFGRDLTDRVHVRQ